MSFLKSIWGEEFVDLDIETDSTDWMTTNIGSIQFAFDRHTGYFMNWCDVDMGELSTFLNGKKIIGHNVVKFDGKVLVHNGLDRDSFNVYADTLNMAHCINEMRLSNQKGITGLYTPYYGYDKELEEFKEKYPNISYIDMPFDLRLKYGGMDVCVNFELFENMLEEIRLMDKEHPLDNGNSLEKYYFNEIMPTVNNHLDSELVGVDINVEELYHNGIYFHKKNHGFKEAIEGRVKHYGYKYKS